MISLIVLSSMYADAQNQSKYFRMTETQVMDSLSNDKMLYFKGKSKTENNVPYLAYRSLLSEFQLRIYLFEEGYCFGIKTIYNNGQLSNQLRFLNSEKSCRRIGNRYSWVNLQDKYIIDLNLDDSKHFSVTYIDKKLSD